mgnify:FL=1
MNEEEQKQKTDTKMSSFVKIMLCELIFTALILSAVLSIKYFFKKDFETVKKFYEKYLLTDTTVSEVLDSK